MSWSILLDNGDFSVQNGSFAKAIGSQKLLQDLSDWILTRMGTDIFEPAYGSLINGGFLTDGTPVNSPIGGTNWPQIESFIASDIQRIIGLYQKVQAQKIQQDQQIYNKVTLSPDEVLKSLDGISFNQNEDTLIVTISISNMSGQQTTINIPIENGILG